jgi:SsrA-binding protein
MAKGKRSGEGTRISNRRATHDYFISAKLECGVALVGSEVKSLRDGKAQLQDSYARVENGELYLHGAHIDPYSKAALAYNHDPRRPRKLLAHRREIKKLEGELGVKGTTLIPLAIYFKGGRAKVEVGVGHGKQQHDKRDTLRERAVARDMERGFKEQ